MLDTLLLFGATGDLAGRYLFPSLLHLLRDRLLPEHFRVVAIGRSEHDDAGFGDWLRGRLTDDRDLALLPALLERTHYHALDLADTEAVAAGLARGRTLREAAMAENDPDLQGKLKALAPKMSRRSQGVGPAPEMMQRMPPSPQGLPPGANGLPPGHPPMPSREPDKE